MKKTFALIVIAIIILVSLAPTISSINTVNTNEQINQQLQNNIYIEYYPGAPLDDPKVAYYIKDTVLVRFNETVNIDEIDHLEVDGKSYAITNKFPMLKVAVIEVADVDLFEFIEKIEKRDDIKSAGLDDLRWLCDGPNDPYYQNGSQWGLKAIRCDKAWNIKRKMGLTWITILDTGIDADHEDLKSANIHQWDIIDDDGIANDITGTGHGTEMTGIVLARMNNGKGIAGIAGDAPNIEMIKIFDITGFTTVSLIIEAFEYALFRPQLPPSIILMCFGGNKLNKLERELCAEIAWVWEILFIAAVGNDGLEYEILYPARNEGVVAVGAINEDLLLCRYPGNWGSNYNLSNKDVDLVAPGENIVTTSNTDVTGRKYEYVSGTSAAAAHVAGVAALWYGARAAKKHYLVRKNELSECRHALYSNARLVGDKDPYKYGHGLVDAYGSIPHLKSTEKTQIGVIQLLLKNLQNTLFSQLFLNKNSMIYGESK